MPSSPASGCPSAPLGPQPAREVDRRAPVPASPTTSRSGWASRIARKPARTSAWSSATSTVTGRRRRTWPDRSRPPRESASPRWGRPGSSARSTTGGRDGTRIAACGRWNGSARAPIDVAIGLGLSAVRAPRRIRPGRPRPAQRPDRRGDAAGVLARRARSPPPRRTRAAWCSARCRPRRLPVRRGDPGRAAPPLRPRRPSATAAAAAAGWRPSSAGSRSSRSPTRCLPGALLFLLPLCAGAGAPDASWVSRTRLAARAGGALQAPERRREETARSPRRSSGRGSRRSSTAPPAAASRSMVALADAAEAAAAEDPDRVVAAFAALEAESRASLNAMRDLLGALRSDAPGDRAPDATLDRPRRPPRRRARRRARGRAGGRGRAAPAGGRRRARRLPAGAARARRHRGRSVPSACATRPPRSSWRWARSPRPRWA